MAEQQEEGTRGKESALGQLLRPVIRPSTDLAAKRVESNASLYTPSASALNSYLLPLLYYKILLSHRVWHPTVVSTMLEPTSNLYEFWPCAKPSGSLTADDALLDRRLRGYLADRLEQSMYLSITYHLV
jgi:hypothetical protein